MGAAASNIWKIRPRPHPGVLLLFVILFAAMAGKTRAAETPLNFSILRHAPANATLQDICCNKNTYKFIDEGTKKLSTGFGEHIYWLKFQPLPAAGVLSFGTMVDDITLYLRNPSSGKITKSRIGDLLPIDMRKLKTPRLAFPISDAENQTEIWARIEHQKISAIIPTWRGLEAFQQNESKSLLIHSLVLGAATIMILFNALLGLLVRQQMFLYYSAAVFTLLVGDLYVTGVGTSHVWMPFAKYSNTIFDWSSILGFSFASMFSYTFMRGKNGPPWPSQAILFVPFIALPLAIAWFFVPVWVSQLLLALHGLSFALLSIVIMGILLVKKNQRAKLLLPAMVLSFLPGLGLFLAFKFFAKDLLIPSAYIVDSVLITDALLFPLVMAYRIRLAENEAVSAYHQLHEVQKTVSKRIVETLDNERKRIAADLHDTAGQGLLAISNRLGRILSRHKLSSKQQQEFIKVADYSRGVVGDIRRISHELHPAVIDHLGWHQAIGELFSTLTQAQGVKVDLSIDVEEHCLGETQQIHLYRIIQELLSNIGKHAEAKNCKAQFSQHGNMVKILISDDGNEEIFPSSDSHARPGLGRIIINQRMDILKGTWSLNRKNQETIVQLSFPLQSSNERSGNHEKDTTGR